MNAADVICEVRKLVRRGYFARAASDQRLMTGLSKIGRGNSTEQMEEWFSARSLLASIYDQTGQYTEVFRLVAKSEDAASLLRRMSEDGNRLNALPSSNNEQIEMIHSQRKLVRAEGLWMLQVAISKLRTFELDQAGELMERCRNLITNISGNGSSRFHFLLSQLHYWEARVWLFKNDYQQAKKHIFASVLETEKNLEFHLHMPLREDNPYDDHQLIHAMYSLASCTAFGLAQISHAKGELGEAINLLHPALAMLMGTGDNYRRGGATMIMGAASRALAGTSTGKLDEAIKTLERALELFGPAANYGIAHAAHQARARYQLSLAYLYLAQGHDAKKTPADSFSKESARAAIDKALAFNTSAQGGLEALKEFADPQLKCDVWIVRSRIFRYSQRFDKAVECADTAKDQVQHCSFAQKNGTANALIAHGEARLAEAISANESEARDKLLDEAQSDFVQAAANAGDNTTIAAVTNLHIAETLARKGKVSEARNSFSQASEGIKRIENGWVRRLSADVEKLIKPPESVFQLDVKNLEIYVHKTKSRLYAEAEKQLRGYMLKRSKETEGGEPRTPEEAAIYLGISRPTFFNWLKSLKTPLKKR